jgi:hypothetical protein
MILTTNYTTHTYGHDSSVSKVRLKYGVQFQVKVTDYILCQHSYAKFRAHEV